MHWLANLVMGRILKKGKIYNNDCNSKLAKDVVPNVRFKVAQALEKLALKIDKKIVASEVKPLLESMKKDADLDVKYYSTAALSVIG